MQLRFAMLWLLTAWMFAEVANGYAAATIDRIIRIQPIQVCADDDSACANSSQIIFTVETQKIWTQAGIRVEFLPWHRFHGTAWLDLTVGTFDSYNIFNLAGSLGHGQNADSKVVNLWFVRSIGGSGYYGHSLQNGNGIAVADNIFAANSGVDRLDVIAHELGHNLGLDHTTFGAGGNTNVMSAGRLVPTSQGDIYPDGQRFGQLTAQQIAQARSSPWVSLLPPKLTIQAVTNKAVISWLQQSGFVLESASAVTGLWNQVSSQANPFVVSPDGTNRFYRLRN